MGRSIESVMQYGDTKLFGGITVERRGDDFIAFVGDDRGRWESGKTEEEAIEKLRVSFPDINEKFLYD